MLTAPVVTLPGRVVAQDSTDVSSVPCAIESAASVAPLPQPAASPVASPAASPVASPVAASLDEPADAAVATEIERVVRTLAACQSDGQSEIVAKIVTENYLGQLYGGGERLSRAAYLALAPDLPAVSMSVSDVTDVRTNGVTASADVTTVIGNELERGRWTFIRKQSRELNGMIWQVNTFTTLPVEAPADAQSVAVELNKNAFKLDRATVNGPSVVLNGTNKDDLDHEMLVLRLTGDAAIDSLLLEPGPGLPDGIEFVGQVTVPAGSQGALVLVGLPAGD
jgi:hypothetical protein